MKHLLVKCRNRSEKLAITSMLYGFGYKYYTGDLEYTMEFLEDMGYPHVLVTTTDKQIDFVNDEYPLERSSITLKFTETAKIMKFLEGSVSIEIPISEDYNAIVTKEGIKVGCQDIDYKDFDKLVEATNKMRGL